MLLAAGSLWPILILWVVAMLLRGAGKRGARQQRGASGGGEGSPGRALGRIWATHSRAPWRS